MKRLMRLYLVMIAVLLTSCGGGGGDGGGSGFNGQCTTGNKNQFVYDLLNDSYFWYDMVQQDVDPAAYPSPEALLASVIPEIDRWSYVVPADDFYQYHDEGQYPGMGMAVKFDRSKNLWVRFVYPGSPADDAGIVRTDRILSINGRPASDLPDLDAVWDEVYRDDSATIEIADLTDNRRTVILEWDWVTVSAVLHREVITIGAMRVGYLVFNTFINPALDQLDIVFDYFRQQNVNDLILDLRYNGGGRLTIAQHLASLIAGDNANGEIFKKVIYNDKYSQKDTTIGFTLPQNALGLDRVFVISTGNTCSASEAIIMGLRPFIDVIQVGGTTCGKPVGMHAHEFCDQVILPIEFKSANAWDETDYFWGIAPTCAAADDLSRQLGDLEEDSLRTALYFIANGICPVQARAASAVQDEPPSSINELRGFRRALGAF